MKHKSFRGIAVHSAEIVPGKTCEVGLLLPKFRTTPYRRQQIMGLNIPLMKSGGHLAVRVTASGNTAVKLIGRMQDAKEARAVARHLAKVVGEITGAYSILRQLRNQRAVDNALAQ